jgi:hypothetical protein
MALPGLVAANNLSDVVDRERAWDNLGANISAVYSLWTPAQTTTALWLDAADASTLFDATSGGSPVAADGAVARWEDKSGNANHATQSTEANRPVRKASVQNSLDILRFDGSNDRFTGATRPCTSNAKTIIAVTKRSNTIGGSIFCNGTLVVTTFFTRHLFGTFIGGDVITSNVVIGSNLGTQWESFNVASWTQRSSDRAVSYWNNGTNYATSGIPANEAANTGYIIGSATVNNIEPFPGDFCELVVLNEEASTNTRQRIEGYLAHKWGLTANLPSGHPYRNLPPVP